MSKKQKNLNKIVQVDWIKLIGAAAGLLIGVVIAIITVIKNAG